MREAHRVAVDQAAQTVVELTALSTTTLQVAQDLFAIAQVVESQPALRRALTDPSREAAAKVALLNRLFASLQGVAVDAVAGLSEYRWSTAADFSDAVTRLATQVALQAADQAGQLDAVQDQLHTAARVIGTHADLRDALSVRTPGSQRKVALVQRLLAGQAEPATVAIATHAVLSSHLRVEKSLTEAADLAAQVRNQVMATVRVAMPLTEQQRQRLTDILTSRYNRPVRLRVDLDPALLGGLVVSVDDEVIDLSMAGRIADIRHQWVGP